MLADDSPLIAERFLKMVDWAAFGFEKVLSAPDGEVALELYRQHHPDLIIADIQMPGLDGIKLAEVVLGESPHAAFYFLTSYEEFSYARAAANLGVRGYLLKHEMNREKLEALLRAVREDLSRSRLTKAYSAKAALHGLLQEAISGKGVITQKENYEVCFPGRYSLLVMEPCFPYPVLAKNFGKEEDLVPDGPIPEGIIPERAIGEALTAMPSQPVAYVWLAKKHLMVLLDESTSPVEYAFLLGKNLWDHCQLHFQGILMAALCPILECAGLYWRNRDLEELRIFFPMEELIHAQFVQKPGRRPSLQSFDKPNAFLANRDHDSFMVWLDQAFLPILEARDGEGFKALTQYCCDRLLEAAQGTVSLKSGATFRVLGGEENSWYEARAIYRYLRGCFQTLWRILPEAAPAHFSSLTNEAIRYINQHYAEQNLDLEVIARELGVSSGHLGVLFRQETGETLWQLIIKVRMERAKELLKSKSAKISDVYPACGYSSASYFSKAFRDTYGLTPKEYQRKEGKQ